MTSTQDLKRLQKKVWDGRVPLQVTLAREDCKSYDDCDSYILLAHRISYLPLLLPRLHRFFSSSLINPDVHYSQGWFSFEDVLLKWHHPLGLLFDLYSGAKEILVDENVSATEPNEPLMWKLTLHFSGWPRDQLISLDEKGLAMQDAFNNSVKEASFIRHGTGKVIMSLGKEPTMQLWEAVEKVDVSLFSKVQHMIVHPVGEVLRHIPIKIYLPSIAEKDDNGHPKPHLRVVQGLVAPNLSTRQNQTLGMALHTLVPELFPSRRSPLLAYPILHGAIVPLSVGLEELGEWAPYADGFLHIAITMMN